MKWIAILFFTLTVYADPVDTAYDLLDAIGRQDGYALEDILSNDLYVTITGFLDQVRGIIATDPVLAEDVLSSRYGDRITVYDFEVLSNEEILGKLMGEMNLQPSDNIEHETAELQGRNATVVLTYIGGGSISFIMIWEEGEWKICDSSLLERIFS